MPGIPDSFRFLLAFDWDKAFKLIPEALGDMLKVCESCEWRPAGVRVMTFDAEHFCYHSTLEEMLFRIRVPYTTHFEVEGA